MNFPYQKRCFYCDFCLLHLTPLATMIKASSVVELEMANTIFQFPLSSVRDEPMLLPLPMSPPNGRDKSHGEHQSTRDSTTILRTSVEQDIKPILGESESSRTQFETLS